ncbi:c-type cytochrome [Mariprofundus ferrooxydans]|uniref:Cytochrome c2 n=1 Tax=Mariprofundus ferrooxydans PV-1 TaxID=314345 RepID=Q0EXC1_9PROT|nr:cytochrome c [Mariprofundus ferrooxydans]EAU53869.1 cytochrome c2 [Mariprofundus ferrooxydans PV-1]KON48286.1 cytochrome C [Mariprofundus ferrooxydans]
MKKLMMIAASAAFVLSTMALAPVAAQAAAWGKCKACHNFTEKKKVGPGLAGVFGRHVGIMPDMNYSADVKGGDWSWDEAHLREWMCNSKKAVKEFTGNPKARTKMPAQKICDAAKQDEVLAKLKSI